MAQEFARLVSQANPALRYRPANSSYQPPYSDDAAIAMDPFFDDDNEDDLSASASAFSKPIPPSGSKDSDISQIPFRSRGAPPAGTSISTSDPPAAAASSSRGGTKIWTFDEDDVFQSPSSGVSPAVSGMSLPAAGPRRGKKRKWRWPWQEEPRPTGDRIVPLNDETRNADYLSNAVSTSKYNLLTFVPKFFTGVYLFLIPSLRLSFFLVKSCLYLTSHVRSIFESCQHILLVHLHYPTSSRSVPDEQVHHYRSLSRRPLCVCF
jgi:phospholipid-transporting ATPase